MMIFLALGSSIQPFQYVEEAGQTFWLPQKNLR